MTHLNPPIHLEGTGALWAQVGKTAMDASAMLQNSALNPEVRARMKEEVARYQVGTAAAQHALKNPHWLYATTGLGQGGPQMVAPITEPVTQQNAQNIDWNQEGSQQQQQQQQQQPTITRTGSNTGIDQNGIKYHEATPGSNQWIKGELTPNPSPNLNAGMAQGGLVRGYATGGSVDSSDSADHDALIRRMQQEHHAVLGAPPGTFLNPATGSYEPLQAPPQQPPAPTTPSPGMFAARTAAPAPSAPTAPPAQQPTQQPAQQPSGQAPQMTLGATANPPPGMELAGTEQAFQQPDQASTAAWQAQNAHPVMASGDALAWMKNFDTGAQRATYLPHGGPNGEPAYAFHMRGGGINTVPISQIVKNGGGPLVAGQNTSAALSTSDAIMNQPQQQPQGMQPPGQPPAAPQPSPGALGAANQQAQTFQQQGGMAGMPPPAPSAVTDTTGAIASDQGGLQGAPPSAPTGARIVPWTQASREQMAAQQQMDLANQNQGAQLVNVSENAQTTKDKANATPAQLESDANSSNPIYDWRPGTDDHGNKYTYTELPDPEGRPFVTQRYIKGTLTGFQPGTWNTENREKEQIYDSMVAPGAKVPIPKDENGNPIKMDATAINGFNADQRAIWLKYINDFGLHSKAPLATDPEGQGLANSANAVRAAQRIKDKILYLQQNNIPMSVISQPEIIRSEEAGYAKEQGPVGFGWGVLAREGPPNKFVDELNGDYKQLNSYLAKVPGGTYPKAETPKPEEWGTPAIGDVIPAMGFPKTTNVSTVPALNRIGSGDNYEQALGHIQEVLDNAKRDYKQQVDKLGPAGFRTPDVDAKNLSDLADPKKGYIDDPTNKMWDAQHQKMANPYGPIPLRKNALPFNVPSVFDTWTTRDGGESAQSTAKPSPTPETVSQQEYDAAKSRTRNTAKPGELYQDVDKQVKRKP